MKTKQPKYDNSKRVFSIYVGRKLNVRLDTTQDEATRVWATMCDENPGTTVSLYDGYSVDSKTSAAPANEQGSATARTYGERRA